MVILVTDLMLEVILHQRARVRVSLNSHFTLKLTIVTFHSAENEERKGDYDVNDLAQQEVPEDIVREFERD